MWVKVKDTPVSSGPFGSRYSVVDSTHMTDRTNDITIRIHPPDDGHEVSVQVLVQSLTTLEELLHLCAFSVERRTIQQRFRVPRDIQAKYELRMQAPTAGSYAVTGRLVSRQPELLTAEHHATVMHTLQEVGRSIQDDDLSDIARIIVDPRIRHRVLQAFIGLCPTAGSGYELELSSGDGSSFVLGESTPRIIAKALETFRPRIGMHTVTGILDAIHFNERKLDITYLPKRRKLVCNYNDDLEVFLWENRRDLIQVRGSVVLDMEGHPERIDDVEEITELDLSPFRINRIETDSGILMTRVPVIVVPYLTEDQRLLYVDYDPWNLHVYAESRRELGTEVTAYVRMLWREYALGDDSVMTEHGGRLKYQLLQDLELVNNAKK